MGTVQVKYFSYSNLSRNKMAKKGVKSISKPIVLIYREL